MGTKLLAELVQDIKYAARTMRRTPGFALTVIGVATLGVGAGSAIFAILNVAFLKAAPVAAPARLLSLSQVDRRTR